MAVNVATEEITLPNGMPAFFAYPEQAGAVPAVILMHERYGLVQHTRDQAVRCATDGYATIAPDFFFRHADKNALNAGDSRYDLTDPESVELIDVAMAWLRDRAEVYNEKIAVAGYCQTGRHPLVYAAHRNDVAAVVLWYGGASKREWGIKEEQPEALEDLIARVGCPIFGAFGSNDHIIAVEDVVRLRNVFESHFKTYDLNIYSGAPHGWLNDTMPGRYRKQQAEAGWAAQQSFLERTLKNIFTAGDDIQWRFNAVIPQTYDFSKNVRLE
ncbi:MAG: dienelactone hydrolase family protein [Marinobacter sp.]|uniref:dienelactone hydrolase family protein n=1 Tax=Marinobacter sp. TaxID=50741 RepID=UPI0034A06EDD